MQKELNNLESNIIKEWQDLMIEAKKMTSDFLGQVDWMENQLEERAKEFHHRVEEIKEDYKKQLNEMKTANVAILHEQEKKVSQGLEKVKQKAKECEDRLRSTYMESLLEHEVARDPLPKLSCAIPPVFTPSQIDTKALLKAMFGQLNVPKTNQGAATTESTTAGHVRLVQISAKDTQTRGATAPTKPPSKLIPKPSVQSEFHTETAYPSVTCVGSGLAWVRTKREMIQLVDRHGIVKDTIHRDFDFSDMVLSPQGDILLTDRNNNCIKSISGDKTVKTLFKVKWTPASLCCLHTGDIAVTFHEEGRVIIYSISGEVIKELDKKLFREPHSLAQNKVNSDLYISQPNFFAFARKVVALDKDYRVRYEYTGQHDCEHFDPHGLCTDNDGRVLITDSRNHRLEILDKDGNFLQYLLTGSKGHRGPCSIDVDSEGNTWVGEMYSGVKVVKYLQ